MIDFHNTFCRVFINFLTVKVQNTLMKFIFLLNSVTNTRSSFQRLKQYLRKSVKGLNSASYSGPSLWNKLPIEIKRSGSTNSFKQCKKLLSNKNGTYRFVNIFLISGDDNICILIALLQIFLVKYPVS